MIRYREGHLDDAAAIADLFAACFTSTFGHLYRPEDLRDFLSTVTADAFREELADPDYHFRLAEDNGAIAGFVKLGPAALPIETPPGTIELRQLYLLDAWQGQGIAAALMDWSLATARAIGCRHVQLSVYVDNHRARRLYERYGFERIGRYDFLVGSHTDEDVVMRCTLSESVS